MIQGWMIHEIKMRKDNRKKNIVCIDRYETYNICFGFLGPLTKGLVSLIVTRGLTLEEVWWIDRGEGM